MQKRTHWTSGWTDNEFQQQYVVFQISVVEIFLTFFVILLQFCMLLAHAWYMIFYTWCFKRWIKWSLFIVKFEVFYPKHTSNSSGDEIVNVNFFMTTTLYTYSYQCTPEASEFSEITQSKGHHSVQGHSRSPILVPIESSYTTSYCWLILTYLLSCTVSEL